MLNIIKTIYGKFKKWSKRGSVMNLCEWNEFTNSYFWYIVAFNQISQSLSQVETLCNMLKIEDLIYIQNFN